MFLPSIGLWPLASWWQLVAEVAGWLVSIIFSVPSPLVMPGAPAPTAQVLERLVDGGMDMARWVLHMHAQQVCNRAFVEEHAACMSVAQQGCPCRVLLPYLAWGHVDVC